jgi:hypothetical protein
MSDLTSIEKMKLEKFFGMDSGYVLDFSNRTFDEFLLDNTGVEIYQSKYNYASGSKANRLRAFWNKESNIMVGNLTMRLLDYWKTRRDLSNQVISFSENSLYDECLTIAERLINNTPGKTKSLQDIEFLKKKELETNKENQLNLLLHMFDDLAISVDHQRRGFLLQDLLTQLFRIHEIPVTKSFLRNNGGEQIDGAFSYQGWHYLVECKWTKKLADIRELDSLYGKVIRSGRQAMGVFLSIEGWSENVPLLLKQNTEKCILLMEGYDLRSVLSGAIELEKLLNAKIAKLNIESEPYLSATEFLKGL